MAETPYALGGRRVWIAGHGGMVGAALVRRLGCEDCEIVTIGREALDLRRQADVEDWMAESRPDAVFMAAATVGGIFANDTRPAEFIYDNLAIETNVIHAAWLSGIGKLLLVGSACAYPGMASQPMAEDCLLTGPPEPTNEWYSVAKIAGIKLCQGYRRQYGADFICAMPINLYGPGDKFGLEGSHVLPALMARTHHAKAAGLDEIEVWGSGAPLREFLYVDDLADALVFLMKHYSAQGIINVGAGAEISIRDLAALVAEVVGFRGGFRFDTARPDGAPRKRLDTGRMSALGWQASTGLRDGMEKTYRWYLEQGLKY